MQPAPIALCSCSLPFVTRKKRSFIIPTWFSSGVNEHPYLQHECPLGKKKGSYPECVFHHTYTTFLHPMKMWATLIRVTLTTSRILHNKANEALLTPRLPPLITVKTHPTLPATCRQRWRISRARVTPAPANGITFKRKSSNENHFWGGSWTERGMEKGVVAAYFWHFFSNVH